MDEAHLPDGAKRFVRFAFPTAAMCFPIAFFLSVLTPDASQPNALINLAFVGALLLAAGVLTLGVGLIRSPEVPTGG